MFYVIWLCAAFILYVFCWIWVDRFIRGELFCNHVVMLLWTDHNTAVVTSACSWGCPVKRKKKKRSGCGSISAVHSCLCFSMSTHLSTWLSEAASHQAEMKFLNNKWVLHWPDTVDINNWRLENEFFVYFMSWILTSTAYAKVVLGNIVRVTVAHHESATSRHSTPAHTHNTSSRRGGVFPTKWLHWSLRRGLLKVEWVRSFLRRWISFLSKT